MRSMEFSAHMRQDALHAEKTASDLIVEKRDPRSVRRLDDPTGPDSALLGKIILVEDNPGDALLLREMLAEAGQPHEAVTVADSLDAACRCLEADHADLVLLDLMLPDSGSYRESISRIREVSDVPIVAVTSLMDHELGIECIRWGAEDFLSKQDIEPGLLLRVARHSISRHRINTERLNDIVSRFEAGRERHESINASADALAVVDEAGKVLYLNEAASRCLDCSFEDAIRTSLLMLVEQRAQDRRRRKTVNIKRIGDTVWDGHAAHILMLSLV